MGNGRAHAYGRRSLQGIQRWARGGSDRFEKARHPQAVGSGAYAAVLRARGERPHRRYRALWSRQRCPATGSEVVFRFTEEGRYSQAVLEEFSSRLDIARFERNRTHWAVK